MDPRDEAKQPPRLRVADRRAPMSLGKTKDGTFDSLCRQVLDSIDPKVQETWQVCQTLGRLKSLCSTTLSQVDEGVRDLAGLFDRLCVSRVPVEFSRWADIYGRCLEPLVALHFRGGDRERLGKSLKSLIILRLLWASYQSGCPSSSGGEEAALLATLHARCKGMGLMVWNEGAGPVYVVETERSQFVEWVITRMSSFLGRTERDKAVSDALWSMLFPTAECGLRQERALPTASLQPCPGLVSGSAFPGREGVGVRCPGQDERVLVFESPWEMDTGRRVHRALKDLPAGVPVERVWIWVPKRPSRRETEQVTCYMAAGRALRELLCQESAGEVVDRWLVRALRRRYVRASMPALRAIVECYRQGMVVAGEGTWRPEDHEGSMECLIRGLLTWADGKRAWGSGVCDLTNGPSNIQW